MATRTACPVAATHDPQFRRGAGKLWWLCSCGQESAHLYRTPTGAQLAYGWHLLAVERLRRTRAVDLRQHLLPDIDPHLLRAPVVDVELPPCG